MNYIIGVDIGTTAVKAVLFDQAGHVHHSAIATYQLFRNAMGMAEEDPQDIQDATEQVIHENAQQITDGHLLTVAFSCANQSVILLNHNFQPLTRAILWADTRARNVAKRLKSTKLGHQLYAETGNPIHPMSPLTKIMWLHENHPELIQQTAYYSDIKSYLFYNWFHQFKLDISLASCTGLMDTHHGTWSDLACQTAGISKAQLPQIVNSTDQISALDPAAAQRMGIDPTTPFIFGAFDGAMSNLGVGAVQGSTVAITIGTSAALRVITDHPVIDPQERLFCYHVDQDHWIIGGPLNNGGDVFQWAVENLVDGAHEKLVQAYNRANQVIAKTPAGAHGLFFLPFLGGERAPLWDANARGSFIGLSELHTRADMLRAVMEGICFNIGSVFATLTAEIGQPYRIMATGGFARSAVWRQMLTDILDCPIAIPESFESGCLGAFTMAMESLGLIHSFNTVDQWIGSLDTYHPAPKAVAIYDQMKPIYQQLSDDLKSSYTAITNLQQRLQ